MCERSGILGINKTTKTMKKATITLFEFKELNEDGKRRAIEEHQDFLNNELKEFEDENGEMQTEYRDHSEEETIESIELNEYLFFHSGNLANCVTYTGKHPKAGITELKFEGQIITL